MHKSPIDALRRELHASGQLTLAVRVHAGARRTAVKETLVDGSLKVEIAAPADRGKANDALVRLLAKSFGVPMSGVEILVGGGSRRKSIRITRFQE